MIDTFVFDFDSALAEISLDLPLLKKRLAALASAFQDPDEIEPGCSAFDFMEVTAEKIGGKNQALGMEYHSRGRLMITSMELAEARKGALCPWTRPVLALLQKYFLKTVIITHFSTAAVKTIFPDIIHCCDVFVPREAVRWVKPDPAHLLEALERCEASPEKTILITGRPSGIGMAREAKTLVGAVCSDERFVRELVEGLPDFYAEDGLSLVNLIAEKYLL